MKLLLDTHALLWWMHEPEKLSGAALEAISDGDNQVFVSAVSAMEIATKQRINRLDYTTPMAENFAPIMHDMGFVPLSVDCAHAARAGGLAGSHRDPWDRLLAAQAQIEDLALVTVDPKLTQWLTNTVW